MNTEEEITAMASQPWYAPNSFTTASDYPPLPLAAMPGSWNPALFLDFSAPAPVPNACVDLNYPVSTTHFHDHFYLSPVDSHVESLDASQASRSTATSPMTVYSPASLVAYPEEVEYQSKQTAARTKTSGRKDEHKSESNVLSQDKTTLKHKEPATKSTTKAKRSRKTQSKPKDKPKPKPISASTSESKSSSRRRRRRHSNDTEPADGNTHEEEDEEDEEQDTDSPRSRNRTAAAKCRAKRKKETSLLETDEVRITEQHDTLMATRDALRDEVVLLREMVLAHSHCGCETIQQYIRNSAKAIGETGGTYPAGQLDMWEEDGQED